MTEDAGVAIYVAIRADLALPPGKAVAQACHAVMNMRVMGQPRCAVIVVRAEDERHLERLIAEAAIADAPISPVIDAGLTIVPPGTLTCVAIGPVARGALKHLSNARLY